MLYDISISRRSHRAMQSASPFPSGPMAVVAGVAEAVGVAAQGLSWA